MMGRMKRVAATLVVALVLVGCGTLFPEPVLVTGIPAEQTLMMGGNNHGGCLWLRATGLLVADPKYGTAVVTDDWASETRPTPPTPIPVVWPRGFSARRSGSEVQVLDPRGNVVAVTGNTYRIDGGFVADREPTSNGNAPSGFSLAWPGLGVSKAWWACGDVMQTPNASGPEDSDVTGRYAAHATVTTARRSARRLRPAG